MENMGSYGGLEEWAYNTITQIVIISFLVAIILAIFSVITNIAR